MTLAAMDKILKNPSLVASWYWGISGFVFFCIFTWHFLGSVWCVRSAPRNERVSTDYFGHGEWLQKFLVLYFYHFLSTCLTPRPLVSLGSYNRFISMTQVVTILWLLTCRSVGTPNARIGGIRPPRGHILNKFILISNSGFRNTIKLPRVVENEFHHYGGMQQQFLELLVLPQYRLTPKFVEC